jgi:hypothetical protein
LARLFRVQRRSLEGHDHRFYQPNTPHSTTWISIEADLTSRSPIHAANLTSGSKVLLDVHTQRFRQCSYQHHTFLVNNTSRPLQPPTVFKPIHTRRYSKPVLQSDTLKTKFLFLLRSRIPGLSNAPNLHDMRSFRIPHTTLYYYPSGCWGTYNPRPIDNSNRIDPPVPTCTASLPDVSHTRHPIRARRPGCVMFIYNLLISDYYRVYLGKRLSRTHDIERCWRVAMDSASGCVGDGVGI